MANIDIIKHVRFKTDQQLIDALGENNVPDRWKNAAPFQAAKGLFRILDVERLALPEVTEATLYFELTEEHPLYNGRTTRIGNLSIPKQAISALGLDFMGNVQNPHVLAAILAERDLEEFIPIPATVETPEEAEEE